MTRTREKAIEAGAQSDAAFDGRDWTGMGRADRARYLSRSGAALDAMLPIIGEDLVRLIENDALDASVKFDFSRHKQLSDWINDQRASAIRTRIAELTSPLSDTAKEG